MQENPRIDHIPEDATDCNGTLRIRDANLLIFGTIDGILMLAILSGNILVIFALNISRKLSGVVSNKFILNLALSDFFVGLSMPYHLAFYLVDMVSTDRETCILRFVIVSFACTSSVLNLIIIAIDRYIAIVHPLHYTRYMTRPVANCLMTCGWILAFAVATIPLYWNKWTPQGECGIENVLPKFYVNLVLSPMFVGIWGSMFMLYFRIWKEAAGHAKRLRNFQTGAPSDWKSVQVVLLILGCFTVCWLPYLVVIFYILTTDTSISSSIYESAFTLAMSNSCMNPIIYAWKNTNFRKAFCCLLKCKSPNSDIRPTFITNHIPSQDSSKKNLTANGVHNNKVGVCNITDVLTSEMNLRAELECIERNEKCNGDANTSARDCVDTGV